MCELYRYLMILIIQPFIDLLQLVALKLSIWKMKLCSQDCFLMASRVQIKIRAYQGLLSNHRERLLFTHGGKCLTAPVLSHDRCAARHKWCQPQASCPTNNSPPSQRKQRRIQWSLFSKKQQRQSLLYSQSVSFVETLSRTYVIQTIVGFFFAFLKWRRCFYSASVFGSQTERSSVKSPLPSLHSSCQMFCCCFKINGHTNRM